MIKLTNQLLPPKPDTEAERLRNLRDYRILDSSRDQDFDDITALASQICGTSISLVSLVDEDRQWFKSSHGLPADVTETPRDDAFCAYNILDASAPLVVPDANKDARFSSNLLVTDYPHITFYAGAPLVSAEGHTLGSLCVIDPEQKVLTAAQLNALSTLARQVVKLMELRRALQLAEARHNELQRANETLKDFSHIIAHDLKAPLRNIRGFTEIVLEDYGETVPAGGKELLNGVIELADEARLMVDGVLRYGSALHQYSETYEHLDLEEVVTTIGRRIGIPEDCALAFAGPERTLYAPRVPVEQILQNLIGNAVKFRDKPCPEIVVACRPVPGGHRLSVKDNGPGFSQREAKRIFSMFYTTAERTDKDGHGVGLNIVKRMTELLGGELSVWSEPGEGAEIAVVLREDK